MSLCVFKIEFEVSTCHLCVFLVNKSVALDSAKKIDKHMEETIRQPFH